MTLLSGKSLITDCGGLGDKQHKANYEQNGGRVGILT